MTACHACLADAVEQILDLGPQPICNRFLRDDAAEEFTHPMRLGQCRGCGLIQLIAPAPAHELLPPYDWITYNEAEGHLDDVVAKIVMLEGLTPDAVIGGVSFKDDSTLARLRARGYAHVWRLDPAQDLGIHDRRAGIETIQDALTPARAADIARRRGKADVMVVRHILEHTHETRRFLEALRSMIRPGGYAVFESPDCTKAFDLLDYTTLWEEHLLYFTPGTFEACLTMGGFLPVYVQNYPYTFENALVAITRPHAEAVSGSRPSGLLHDTARQRAGRFAAALPSQRERLRRYLSRFRGTAIFGAGHLSCTYLNIMCAAEHIAFVVDDHPQKQGLLMPGSHLPILPSSQLLAQAVPLCLMSLSPESEAKVLQKQAAYCAAGGRFASIFPSSAHALPLDNQAQDNHGRTG
jgi:hypothetical protein